MAWFPIADLSPAEAGYRDSELHSLGRVWREQRQRLESSGIIDTFLEKYVRRVAIETGLIERLYTLDRGVTFALIEHGLDESLIAHGASDRPAAEVIALIRDQQSATERVFDFVGANRPLSASFIKQLHQLLTKNQPTTTAVDPHGYLGEVELIRGDWKKLPNNPTRPNGEVYEYCPPEQVGAQIDQMIGLHLAHLEQGVSPEVEAAWLHHRFTQIHPFQDGNGRVARLLASLVLLRAGWFPLIVLTDEVDDISGRKRYIDALEQADGGDLQALVRLFAASQKRAFLSALSLSETVLSEHQSIGSLIETALERVRQSGVIPAQDRRQRGRDHATRLHQLVCQRLEQTASRVQQTFGGAGYDSQVFGVRWECEAWPSERSKFYRQQIIATAKRLNYYANLSAYRSWAKLTLRVNGSSTVVVVSFHELGTQPQEVFAVSAFAYRRVTNDEVADSAWDELEPLCETPFTFTYQDTLNTLEDRMGRWTEEVIRLSLIYWQKGL